MLSQIIEGYSNSKDDFNGLVYSKVNPTNNLQLVISESLEDPEWDSFVSRVNNGHHVQTSLWAQVKNVLGWEPLRLIVKDARGIIAGLQMLIRAYPLIGKVGYVSKGPIYTNKDSDFVNSIIVQLQEECKLRNIKILVLQPPNFGGFMHGPLTNNQFQPNDIELAPTASILIDLSLSEEILFSQIHKSTRKNIRSGLKHGVKICEGTTNSLKSFYDLHLCTSHRQHFLPYPYKYFEAMQKILEPKGYFQLLFVEYENHLVSSLMLIPFGDAVLTKLSGWSGLYEKLKPNDVLHWAAIQWAKTHGYRYLDLEGINREGAITVLQGNPLPEKFMNSPDHIKYKFGGKVMLFPQAYDYISFEHYRWILRKLYFFERNNSFILKMVDFLRKR